MKKIEIRVPVEVRVADLIMIGHTVKECNGYAVWFITADDSVEIKEAMLRSILAELGYSVKYSSYRVNNDLICVSDMPFSEYSDIEKEAVRLFKEEETAGEDWCKAHGINI